MIKNYFYYGQYPGNYTQQIIRFDNNFDIVDRKSISSSAFFDYIGVVSDSSFFYHSIDFWSGNQLFRYTSDNFTTSDTLKFYDKFSLAKHYKEIIYNGIRYVAFFNYNYKEKELNVNLFNYLINFFIYLFKFFIKFNLNRNLYLNLNHLNF